MEASFNENVIYSLSSFLFPPFHYRISGSENISSLNSFFFLPDCFSLFLTRLFIILALVPCPPARHVNTNRKLCKVSGTPEKEWICC